MNNQPTPTGTNPEEMSNTNPRTNQDAPRQPTPRTDADTMSSTPTASRLVAADTQTSTDTPTP